MLFHSIFTALCLVTLTISSPLRRIQKRDVPDYVRKYAPVAYLHSKEAYFPSSIADQLVHTHPEDNNGTSITSFAPLTLDNLNTLNSFADGGTDVYLTSNEGIQGLPSWFNGQKPDATGSTGAAITTVIVTVSKPGNITDAFYFYFYAYNQGNWVLDSSALEFGDHVGDWEHTMLRFVNGLPQTMWFSQHASGEAFAYAAVEKFTDGMRPVVYVAKGSHANYAIKGNHDHTIPGLNLPGGPVEDHTDAGVFWDPAINAYTYSYDDSTSVFASYTGADPTGYLDFTGRWGDDQLPDGAKGQVNVFGERKYEAGPTGPRDKDLARQNVCSGDGSCKVKTKLSV